MSPNSNSNREQKETNPRSALPGLRIPGTAAEALFRVSLACLRGNSEPQNLLNSPKTQNLIQKRRRGLQEYLQHSGPDDAVRSCEIIRKDSR